MIDWSKYPNFSEDEFKCSHTGRCEMREEFIAMLQLLRNHYGKPMFISSGYRDPSHPVEAMKDKPGEHAEGLAADIICYTDNALSLLQHALNLGVTRIGVHQKGRSSSRFIHLGLGDRFSTYPSGIWTY